jgi:ribonuclease H / adenosylcobalamin/alpha-ribazole phosphatase
LNELEFGGWVEKSFSALKDLEEWREFNKHRSIMRPPGGEYLMEAQARAWGCIETIREHHRDATVAAITHGDIIRCLLMLLLGMPLDYILRLEIAPASVSEIILGDGGPLVCSMNETVYRWRSEIIKGHCR